MSRLGGLANGWAHTVARGGPVFVAIGAALWGTDIYFRPALAQQLSATQVVFAEDLLLCLCFVPLLPRVVRELRGASRRSVSALLIVGVGPQAIATALFTRAVALAFPAHGAPDVDVANEVYLLYLAQPIVALVLARVVLRERRRALFWPLVAIAVAGVYLVVFQADAFAPVASLPHARTAAALYVGGAVALWGAGTVLGRAALQDVSFLTTAAMRFGVALPVLLVLLLIDRGSSAFSGYAPSQLPQLAGLVLVPGLLAMLIYYRALSVTPASAAAIAELAYPVVLFLAFSLPPPAGIGAPLHPVAIAGAVVLIAAVTTLNFTRERLLLRQRAPRLHSRARVRALGPSSG